ncbi:glycosyltransferase family 87 protein [Breoghania sp.]|uniref:glycosyltransferase family 87 protein n=1 Tax=Breoghania sp. TaxID=2065378 RepID=UPI00261E618E|nr:glycosyltransferase family 87 protein [Breoghania sp.]MDJ0930227.1 glycosyltransferase family 87 protein [Breoghania sp.]
MAYRAAAARRADGAEHGASRIKRAYLRDPVRLRNGGDGAYSFFLAGIVIGLLTYKPQLGVLIPVALLVAGYWRTIFGAAVSTLLFALASWLAFGSEPWLVFIAQAYVGGEILENGWVDWEKMVSVYVAARVLGLSSNSAWICQGAAALIALGAVVATWWRAGDFTACV